MVERPPEDVLAATLRAADPTSGVGICRTADLEPASKGDLNNLFDAINECREEVVRRAQGMNPPDTVIVPMGTYHCLSAVASKHYPSAFIAPGVDGWSKLMQMDLYVAVELDAVELTSVVLMDRPSVTARKPEEVSRMDDVAVIRSM